MKKIISFISSMKFMTLLILLFAIALAFGTFVENDFGRSSAKALIYNTWWFELMLALFVYNLFNNLIKYRLFRLEKLPVLIFHLAFIIIIIGSAITRYISYEGMMHIREGESTNLFISDDTFLQIHIDDKLHQYKYDKKLYLSAISRNNFNVNVNFKQNDIYIKYVDFLPNVKDSLFVNAENGKKVLHLIVPGENGMQSEYINENSAKFIKGNLITFNSNIEGDINFNSFRDSIICNSSHSTSTMNMNDKEQGIQDPLKKFNLKNRVLYTTNGLNFVFKDLIADAELKQVSSSKLMQDGSLDALKVEVGVNGENRIITLFGGKGSESKGEYFSLGNLNFKLSYGSKYFTTPFSVKLRDFQLDRYSGSSSPSSFAAEVSIIDKKEILPYRIYMNNVLQYKGFRFFQSSYDEDEKGTILSVNHDWWGTLISYVGYFLLGLGFLLVFFYKNSRFNLLSHKLKKMRQATRLLMMLSFIPLLSTSNNISEEVISTQHTEKFSHLLIQDNGGRIKPVHTLCSEYFRKIYGKDSYKEYSAPQLVLGMMTDPIYWSKVDLIKVKSIKIKEKLKKENNSLKSTRVSFNDFFNDEGNYILKEIVDEAYAKLPKDRSKEDKEVIKIDEKVNICFTIYNGGIFRFFPIPSDTNNTWLSYRQNEKFFGNDSLFVSNIMPMYFRSLKDGLQTNNWANSDSIVNYISKFQNKYGQEIIPDTKKIKLEVIYNKVKIFSRLFIFYLITGLVLLISLIFQLFKRSKIISFLVVFCKWLIISGFLFHSVGLAIRWYISGHAPWSNGYESMIYIAWATVFSGLFFSRSSLLTLSATAVVSSLLLMVAHLNWLDPEITNLVPVLKSYWLMIHVSIITASYGFFALGAILGLISLWLIIFTNKRNVVKFKNTLSELTIINDKTLEIGLFMLTIGTFLGGIWANESWGRYWGWDPKETWALISVLVYAIILHLRFIPKLKNKYVFNVCSMFAIWTIIMTYFGVNYYLSGLHSYAAGDPMPIPSFVYYLTIIMILSAVVSRINYKKYY